MIWNDCVLGEIGGSCMDNEVHWMPLVRGLDGIFFSLVKRARRRPRKILKEIIKRGLMGNNI